MNNTDELLKLQAVKELRKAEAEKEAWLAAYRAMESCALANQELANKSVEFLALADAAQSKCDYWEKRI